MSALSRDQLIQLHSYSIYPDEMNQKLFSLEDVLDHNFGSDFLKMAHVFSDNDNDTVALSYFTKRYGMFISMQFYMMIAYEEVWQGDYSAIGFIARDEYGRRSLSMTANSHDWDFVDEEERYEAIHTILHEQCLPVIQALRNITSISPLLIWENIFGYMLWHFHTLLQNPMTTDTAREIVDILEADDVWQGIAETSIWHRYTNGVHPTSLINVPVRKTCCFSKDVPGLMVCGFCPLK